MMQEYTFPADPAIARRLVHLSTITSTEITVEVEALALTGLLRWDTLEGLPSLSDRQQAAIQRLIDYKLRGVLLADSEEDARVVALVAARLQGIRPIVVSTRKPKIWKILADRLGFSIGADPFTDTDLLLVDPLSLMTQDVIRDRRAGMLVIEQSDRSDYVQGSGECDLAVVREFERTVVVANFGSLTRTFHSWTRQCDVALQSHLEFLWPNEALVILGQTPVTVNDLRRRGFKRYRPADLYFLFNVVPDLLGDRGPR
jgi:hypothetical protein